MQRLRALFPIPSSLTARLSRPHRPLCQVKGGHHPLGRAKAVLEARTIIDRKKAAAETARARSYAKFNNSVTANNEVKARIDLLRREMIVFNTLFSKMESELQHKKKAIKHDQVAIERFYEGAVLCCAASGRLPFGTVDVPVPVPIPVPILRQLETPHSSTWRT